MALPLDWQSVADRLANYPRDNYLFIGSVMKGVSLGAASFVLLEFSANLRLHWPRLLPWCVALCAALVSYTTWGRGVLLTNSHANIWDNLFPLAMGIIEVLMFGILAVKKDEPEGDRSGTWLNWPFLLAAHAFFAVLLVWNRLWNTDPVADFDLALQPLARDFVGWVKDDRFGASILAVLASVAGYVLWHMKKRKKSTKTTLVCQHIFAGVFILFLLMVVVQASNQRARIDEYITTHAPPAQQRGK